MDMFIGTLAIIIMGIGATLFLMGKKFKVYILFYIIGFLLFFVSYKLTSKIEPIIEVPIRGEAVEQKF